MNSSKSQIPINTRTVGSPEGIYILYIEDYVHTFLQKNIDNKDKTTTMAIFGDCIEEGGVLKFIVSGTAISQGNATKNKDIGATYFPTCTYLGTATVTKDEEGKLRLELYTGGIIIIIDDYYIYYAQNEEMQNYLITWNEGRKESKVPNLTKRTTRNDAAHIGRILQAYDKEEAKVSFMWNLMNVLCLSFVLCFMAYGIITINSYNKIQSLQSGIDYCMKILDTQPVSDDEPIEITNTDSEVAEATQIIESQTDTVAHTEADTQPSTETINSNIPQYYIVQKGDTLRTICFKIYGSYENMEKICSLNDIDNPDNILYGQKLLLP
jgi:hypothetical protein